MRIIAFITFSADTHKILEHIGIGVAPEAPRITPARRPPLWDDCGAQEQGEAVGVRVLWNRFLVGYLGSCGWNSYPSKFPIFHLRTRL